ncbi:MAG: hypothetical protein J1E98_00950 [Lachnospiraceae bacterium]|nr:hypothetical protein [Lachnospiraceae bacterium]
MERVTHICKIALCLFLVIGCNLSIEGHFWPDNILPYVFLVLNGYAVFQVNWQRHSDWLAHKKNKISAVILIIFSIFLQAVILRIYLSDTSVIFIKAAIKALIAGISTAVILILSVFKAYEEKKIPGMKFIIFCLLGLVYFYMIRRMTDNFSIYPIILLMLIYLSADNNRNEGIITKIGAVIPALFETLGYLALTYGDYHGGLLKWLGLAAVGTAVWTFIFYYVLNELFVMLDNISFTASDTDFTAGRVIDRDKNIVLNMNRIKTSNNIKMIAIAVVMIGIRILFWLNWFPALLSKDTYVQIQQALGIEYYSNHHPFLHTMIIKFFMSIGKLLFGSNQAGIAVNAFVSLLSSSLLLLYIIKYYYNRIRPTVWYFAALIFAIEPIHCVYSITIWKDVLFAYVLLAFCFLLIVMEIKLRQDGKLKPYMWFLYVAISFIFCFSRTNGLYAWLFTLPFLLWHYRKKLKPWLISTFVCLMLIAGYKGLLLPYFQVTEPDTVEALSVPLQQIAFTVQNDGNFSENDTDVINSIVDMDSLGKQYNAHISDPVKNLIRDKGYQEYITQNKLDFIKMYISVGVKNPTDYITAFLNQSRGYWYQKMSNYIYFSEGVHRYAAELGIFRDPLFPAGISSLMDKLMDKYCDIWHEFWSLALSTYVVLVLFVYLLVRKRTCFYFLPVIGVFITLVIATPVNDEFRYAYGIYLLLPLLFMQVISQSKTVY